MNPAAASDATERAFEALADDAWLLRLGDRIDPALNAQVHALAARMRQQAPPWLRDLVPAYASLAAFFDATQVDADTARTWLAAQWAALRDSDEERASPRLIEIPVAYGDDHGPDLIMAASKLGLSPDELVARHTAGEYTVALIGFAPGFPYLSGLDPALALPRLDTPRTLVAAGSVAIGGAQTGIYPRNSPGGWRLLGRTPLRLFDPHSQTPSLLRPGDRVRFVAITSERYGELLGVAQ